MERDNPMSDVFIVELSQAEVNLIHAAFSRMHENDQLRSEVGMSFQDKRTRRAIKKLTDRIPATRILSDPEIVILNAGLGL
jgi:hypothetical protein